MLLAHGQFSNEKIFGPVALRIIFLPKRGSLSCVPSVCSEPVAVSVPTLFTIKINQLALFGRPQKFVFLKILWFDTQEFVELVR